MFKNIRKYTYSGIVCGCELMTSVKTEDSEFDSKSIKKDLIQKLGFTPKENTMDVFQKEYLLGYLIEVDFEKRLINYGKKIKSESKTTQNFSQEENWIVLECINRLLDKGYNPEDLILEKVYPTGHGHSGRLDILLNSVVLYAEFL